MKTTLLIITALSIFTAFTPVVSASQDASLRATVNAFVEALKTGDMEALEAITGGKMLEKLNKMRNSDPNYQSFLIKRYAHLALQEMDFQNLTNDTVIALVRVSFDEAVTDLFKWTLSRQADGQWRIVDQPQ